MLTRFLVSALALTLGLTATQAQALSCMRPDIGSSFAAAQERPEVFHIGLGQLRRIGPNVPDGPETGDVNDRVGYSFAAEFEGYFAGPEAFDVGRTVEVTVKVACVSAWCGADSLSEHGLYFLQSEGDGSYSFEAGVCPMFFFDDPVEHQLMAVFGLME